MRPEASTPYHVILDDELCLKKILKRSESKKKKRTNFVIFSRPSASFKSTMTTRVSSSTNMRADKQKRSEMELEANPTSTLFFPAVIRLIRFIFAPMDSLKCVTVLEKVFAAHKISPEGLSYLFSKAFSSAVESILEYMGVLLATAGYI